MIHPLHVLLFIYLYLIHLGWEGGWLGDTFYLKNLY